VRIVSLHLEHFRNYASQTVEFGDHDIHLFIGPNGSGKTNLLEAVSVLSLTKSCRGKDDQDMVQWEQGHYRLRAHVQNDAGDKQLIEVVTEMLPRKRKAFFLNDVKTQVTGFVGYLPTITFLPQDLMLFSGAPSERRRFLDQLLSQLSSDYLIDLAYYQKIVQQRNALLKRIAARQEHADTLDLWDRELAARGTRITLARLEMMETLNLSYAKQLEELGEQWNDVRLVYERKTTMRAQEDLVEELTQMLLQNREKDILLQSTTVGPHREDWQVFRDGRDIPSFASRGQERVAVLALLLLEVSYLELRRGEKPVILLDDAFSELDDKHQKALLESFQGYQVLMTAARMPAEAGDCKIFDVVSGQVIDGMKVTA
jgi:DNA replication and repair protein RecF